MAGLVRSIRRWEMVAVTINAVIGAGIFGLPSRVFALIGNYSVFAFLACAVFACLIVACFAEVGSRFTETGGPYLYAREAFGSVVGFETGFLMWVARVAAFAANSNLMIAYVGFFWPEATGSTARALIITGTLLVLAAINIRGVRNAASANNVFTVGKLIPLFLFVGAGIFFVEPARFSFQALPAAAPFATSVLLLVYAFTGFEMAVIPSGEVKDVQRALPVAILTAIAIIAVIYVLIQIVCIGTLPGLAASERPLAEASGAFLGRYGAAIISAGVILSIIGNLNITLLSASRLPFAMAERRELPPVLAATHRSFHTPHFAIAITAAIMLVVSISGSFIYGLTISTLARLMIYGTTCAALPVLRRRPGAPQAKFRAPIGEVLAGLAILLTFWLLSNSSMREARDTAIAAGVGLAIYGASRMKRRA